MCAVFRNLRKIFSIFDKRRQEKGEPERIETTVEEPEILRAVFLGVISGKGGCGKSTISSSLAILFSVLYGKAALVDLDIINNSSSVMLFSPVSEVLLTTDVTVLNYIVEGCKYEIHQLHKYLDPDKRLSIQIAGKPTLGAGLKELYVLPGCPYTGEQKYLLSKFLSLNEESLRAVSYTHLTLPTN